MRSGDEVDLGGAFPRPGPALRGVLFTLGGLWVALALAINWGTEPVAALGEWLFEHGAGNEAALADGQLWRLVTASMLHGPQGLGHVFFGLLGLYFLGPSLEKTWGGRRFLLFLLGASLTGYGLQGLTLLLLPPFATSRLAPELWFGSLPMVEGIAIAWATSHRGRTVRLFFILPVSSRGLVLFVVGASILAVVAADMPPSGLVAPFGGMLAGWLFAGEPMTVRRLWLRARLRAHERALAELAQKRKRKTAASGLRLIRGGNDANEGGDEPPSSGKRGGGPPVLH